MTFIRTSRELPERGSEVEETRFRFAVLFLSRLSYFGFCDENDGKLGTIRETGERCRRVRVPRSIFVYYTALKFANIVVFIIQISLARRWVRN